MTLADELRSPHHPHLSFLPSRLGNSSRKFWRRVKGVLSRASDENLGPIIVALPNPPPISSQVFHGTHTLGVIAGVG